MRPTELVRRLRTPGWATSQLRDAWLHLRYTWSRSELAGLYRAVRPYTMIGAARLTALYEAVHHVVRSRIPGDVVECGTARGGSAAFLALALERLGDRRTLWAFDTFEGIPPPTAGDPDRAIAARYTGAFRAELSDVQALFHRLGVLTRARFVKGLLQDTVPRASVERISLLHLDCDWYESVRVCLEHLWDRMSPGGIIQVDDYGHWAGARTAVDEFLAARGLVLTMRVLDYTGRQLVKP